MNNTFFASTRYSRAILTFVAAAVLSLAAQVGPAAQNRQDVEKTPAGERVKLFEMMKMFGEMKDVKVIKTAKTSTGETLSVEGMTEGKKQTCAVAIVNEKGAWKLGGEKCNGSF